MVSVMISIAIIIIYLLLHTLCAVPCLVQLTKPSYRLLAATYICYNGKSSDRLCFISANQFNCVYHQTILFHCNINFCGGVLARLTLVIHKLLPFTQYLIECFWFWIQFLCNYQSVFSFCILVIELPEHLQHLITCLSIHCTLLWNNGTGLCQKWRERE